MTPGQVLKKYWGYDSFRPVQLDIIESVLQGKDTLGLMPTGGGKSITFQVPALMFAGLTIVVTPLISLMKDQVDNLKQRGVKSAMLYSGMTSRERRLAYDRARLGVVKLLYVSPERLRSETFVDEMRSWNVSMIVVDEAHCISQWGYDFRPSYLRISKLRDLFPEIPVLALTASATPVVQKDIINNLRFKPGYNTFALSFHRDNLHYVVRYDVDKVSKLIDSLGAVSGCGIVYVRSRRATAQIAETLRAAGISATFYHAGLDPLTKQERQQMWKEDKVRVMVATNAFGMGIDKPDVRVVVHMDVPPSLEEYYQEAGRAGRDGETSYALLIAGKQDKATLTRRLNSAFPPKEFVLETYEKACVFMDIPVGEGYNHVYEFDIEKFSKVFNLYPDSVRGALGILSNAGYFDYNDDPTTRGRVQILIRRDEFYGINLTQEEQNVVNAMLRLYPGIFADYVQIDEATLGTLAHLSQEETYQTLLILKRKKIIDYIPRRVLPYIYLPTSRELKKHIMIPRSVYEERRALMEERINAIRRFVFDAEKCRERVLLEYFGETEVEDCGKCDVCVANRKNRKKLAVDTDKDLTTHIFNCVCKYPGVTMTNFISAMPGREEEVVGVLRHLLGKKKIVRKGNRFYPKS